MHQQATCSIIHFSLTGDLVKIEHDVRLFDGDTIVGMAAFTIIDGKKYGQAIAVPRVDYESMGRPARRRIWRDLDCDLEDHVEKSLIKLQTQTANAH